MKLYQVKYQLNDGSDISSTTVRTSSATQTKEQIKARYNGKIKIISCVEI